MSEWSAGTVGTSLVRDAESATDKIWIARYFASRQEVFGRRPLGWLAPGQTVLRWRSTRSSLAVSPDSGALSAWYEVAHVRAYAALDHFIPKGGWTVVDVGASIGAFSTWAASHMGSEGRIIALEPNPVSFPLLQNSLRGIEVPAVALQLAAGDTDEDVTLHYRNGYTATSSLTAFSEATDTALVQIRRLDEVARELGVTHIDLMKLDVEGAEAIALRGAEGILPITDRVVLETAGSQADWVRGWMSAMGFRLVHVRSRVWDEDGLEILSFQREGGTG